MAAKDSPSGASLNLLECPGSRWGTPRFFLVVAVAASSVAG